MSTKQNQKKREENGGKKVEKCERQDFHLLFDAYVHTNTIHVHMLTW